MNDRGYIRALIVVGVIIGIIYTIITLIGSLLY